MEDSTKLPAWGRLLLAVVIASIITLSLAWFLASPLATLFANVLGYDTLMRAPIALWLVDSALSTIFYFSSLVNVPRIPPAYSRKLVALRTSEVRISNCRSTKPSPFTSPLAR